METKMRARTRVILEEPRHIKTAYVAVLALMIACGLAARAFGLLPIQ